MKTKFLITAMLLLNMATFAQQTDSSGLCKTYFEYYNNADGVTQFKGSFFSVSGSPASFYQWSFGDGTTSTEQSPTHAYSWANAPKEGYYACLTASDNTCKTQYCGYVTSKDTIIYNCYATFSYDVKDMGDYKEVYLFANASPNAVEWKWSTKDSLISNEQRAVLKVRNDVEWVDVCLSVSTSDGCSSYYCQSIMFKDDPACYASFYYVRNDSLSTADSLNITFFGSIYDYTNPNGDTSGTGEDMSTFEWKFDDGVLMTGKQINRNFSRNSDIVKLCLSATSISGCTSQYCGEVYISPKPICYSYFYYSLYDSSATTSPDSVTVSFYGYNYEYMYGSSNRGGDVTNGDTSYYDVDSSLYEWTFDDGVVMKGNHILRTFSRKQDIVNVCLKATSVSGCLSEYCDNVYLKPQTSCYAYFYYNIEKDSLNSGNDMDSVNVTLYGYSYDYVYYRGDGNTDPNNGKDSANYEWRFDDNTVMYGPTITRRFARNQEIIKVCVKSTSVSGCVSEYCDAIYLNPKPTCYAGFQYAINDSVPTIPEIVSVSFYGYTGNDNVQWLWEFGDGTTSTDANPVHSFSFTQEYAKVCLTVTTADGCVASYCDAVYLKPQPTCNAWFGYYASEVTDANGVREAKVAFTDQSYGKVEKWHWKFGDGAESHEQHPVHLYQVKQEKYDVSLTIYTADGCSSTAYNTVYLSKDTINNGCQAFFYTKPYDDLGVSFYSSSLGTVEKYSWDFGDGSYSYEANPLHRYKETGSYYACLTIATKEGCVSLYCNYVSVYKDSISNNCKAYFEYNTTDANTTTGYTYNFYNKSVGTVIKQRWEFGDGTYSEEANPIHIYTKAGHYTVCLSVSTAEGCYNQYCTYISVGNTQPGDTSKCNATFDYYLVYDTQMNFIGYYLKGTSNDEKTQHYWEFGDGTTSTEVAPVHKYQKDGEYNVCHTITKADGCKANYCRTIYNGNNVAFDNAESSGAIAHSGSQMTYSFEYKTDKNADCSWDFGDGTYSKGVAVSHTYSKEGTYKVCVTVNGVKGNVTYATNVTASTTKITQPIEHNLSLFPNPATDNIRLSLDNVADATIQVKILNMFGQTLLQQRINAGTTYTDFDIKALPAGMYIVTAVLGDGSLYQTKFVK